MEQNKRQSSGNTARKKNKLALPASAAVLIAIAAVVLATRSSGGVGEGANGSAIAEAGDAKTVQSSENLVIPISEVSKTATFYPVDVDGVAMEVIAVKAPDGTIRTAFNTCEVCYDSGRGYYEQEGDALVCQNCGNRFETSQVEIQSRGCNPWPIFAEDKTVTDETITITYDFLSASTKAFANWKRSY
jgi:uncharacterized membrane protein